MTRIAETIDWSRAPSLDTCDGLWTDLAPRAVATPFQSLAWLKAASRHHGAGLETAVVVGMRDGRPAIILPLALERGRFATTLRWLGDRWSDYNMPLVERDLFAALSVEDVDAIWARIRPLLGRPDTSVLVRQVTEVRGMPNPFAQWQMQPEPTAAHALRLGIDWPSFEAETYSASARRRLRQMQGKIDRLGGVFTTTCDPEEVAAKVACLLRWKGDQIQARGGLNALDGELGRGFLLDYVSTPGSGVRMHALEISSEPVALIMTMDDDERLLVYQMAYADGETARLSPGRVLTHHLVRLAVEERRRLLDFSVGDEEYKRDLCDLSTGLTSSILAHSPSGQPAALAARGKLNLKTYLKAHPPLLAFARRAHANLSAALPRGKAPSGD